MSLKQFHVFFIVTAAALAFLFGSWSLREWAASREPAHLATGALSILAGFGLAFYLTFFRRKMAGSAH